MKVWQDLLVALLQTWYALLLYLYPRPFRDEFAEEMNGVFGDALEDAAGRGLAAVADVWFREVGTYPLNLARAYFKHGGNRMMEASAITARKMTPGRWAGPFLAALPHLLMGIVFVLSSLLPSWFNYGLLITMGAAFLLAWRQGWPLWSGSWAGYWLFFAYGGASSLLPWRPGLDYLLLLPLLAIGLLFFVRRPLYGLLAVVAPLLYMTRIFAFELVAGGEWVWSGISILLAVTAGAIVWLGSVRAGAVLTVAFQLVAGLIISIARSYLPYRGLGASRMGPRPTPELATLINDFLPLTLAAITLPLALLLLRPLGRLAGRGGRREQHSHKLLLLGMAITLGGVFALRAGLSFVNGTSSTLAAVAAGAGLVLSLGAAVTLIRALWSGDRPPWQDVLLPLLSVFAPLVVFALAQPFATAGQYSDSFQTTNILSYGGVILWAVCALLVIMRSSTDDDGRLPEVSAGDEPVSAQVPGVQHG